MVVVAQLVRALDCGSRGRRFETGLPPKKNPSRNRGVFFFKPAIRLVWHFFTFDVILSSSPLPLLLQEIS